MTNEIKYENLTLKFLLIFFFGGLITFNIIYFNTKKSHNLSPRSDNESKNFIELTRSRNNTNENSLSSNSNELKNSIELITSRNGTGQLKKTVWQTAPNKVEDKVAELMKTWKHLPGWTYNFMGDDSVKDHLASAFPKIDIDKLLKERAILAYDLFRYSIIYQEGGMYADSDIEKAREFEDSMSKLSDCGVIVGIEGDVRDRGDWYLGRLPRRVQICQWSFYAAPKHPLMQLVVDRVARQIQFHQGRDQNLHDQDVMEVTGPGIWSDAIRDYVNVTSGLDIYDHMKCGKSYKYKDVCILNVKGFASSMPHSCGKETEEDTFIVNIHHFLGSWKHD